MGTLVGPVIVTMILKVNETLTVTVMGTLIVTVKVIEMLQCSGMDNDSYTNMEK